jgi:hypothetical protein
VYTVSVAAGITNGNITISPTSAEAGTAITVTATPASGYQLESGSLKYNDGTDHDITGNTFTMPAANVTISGSFEPVGSSQYNITVQQAAGGTISTTPSGTATAGQTVTVTISPENRKKLVTNSLKFNDTVITVSGNTGTFAMPAEDVTITAAFEDFANNEYYISLQDPPPEGGSISVSPAGTGIAGTTITVTVTLNDGYQLQAGSLKYNGTAISGPPPYIFTMPAGNVTVTAEFEKIPIPVTGVSVTPPAAELVAGASLTLTASITPSDADNTAVSWTSDDEDVATVTGSGLTVTVTAVAVGTATITATTDDGSFMDTCVVTVEAGTGLVVKFTGFGDEVINLTLSTANDLSKRDDDVLMVAYTGPGTVTWWLDGRISYGSGSTIAIISRDPYITLGSHNLSAVIRDGSKSASKEVSFRVVE